METKKCTSCKTEIAIDAKKCPNCKADLRNWFVKHWIISSFITIFFISSIMQGFKDWVNNSKIPEHSIIQTTKLINWWVLLEVLITSLSKDTPKIELQSISKELSSKYKANMIELYCSLEAEKANYSSSFAEQHPNAIEECFLGGYNF